MLYEILSGKHIKFKVLLVTYIKQVVQKVGLFSFSPSLNVHLRLELLVLGILDHQNKKSLKVSYLIEYMGQNK